MALTTDQAPVVSTPPAPLTGCDLVRSEAGKYHSWNVTIITAISEAESHCRATAKGDGGLTYQANGRIYGYSVSVLQVRILPGREACDSYDVATNVKCAYAIWQAQGYEAWTKYNNGEYREYLK